LGDAKSRGGNKRVVANRYSALRLPVPAIFAVELLGCGIQLAWPSLHPPQFAEKPIFDVAFSHKGGPMESTSFNMNKTEEHKEGPVAKAIEKQTAKLPSDAFLWLAMGSIGVSAAFQFFGRKDTSQFVGQWAPTLLILGLYNKLVKVAGSDREEQSGSELRRFAA
jgi:hypothetical protein